MTDIGQAHGGQAHGLPLHGDGVVRAARAVDTATHPDCQRRGIFSRLTQQAIADLSADGTRLIYNTPNAKSLPGYLKMGWQMVDKRPIYLLPLRPLRMAWRRIRGSTQDVDASPGAVFDERVIMPWAEFAERHGAEAFTLAESWERRRRRVGLRTERSEAYYSWRYARHPHTAYSVCPLWERGKADTSLAGFAVVRANLRFGWQEAVLCEMVLAEPSPGLGRRLLREVARHTRGDYVAAHFAPGTVEWGSLRRSGFVAAPRQGMTFTVRPLSELPELPVDPRAPAAWDTALGDLEVF